MQLAALLVVIATLAGCKHRRGVIVGGVPVVSGQDADLVLGESDFTSGTTSSLRGTPSATRMSRPTGVTTDGVRLWVADNTYNRVLQWSSIPEESGAAADIFVGQADESKGISLASATSFVGGASACASKDKLVVADLVGNRVLIFPTPTSSLPSAVVVLGQASFTSTTSGKSASELNGPTDTWTDGTRLVVVDSGNSRALIWSSFPSTNGKAADIVLGRSDFGLGDGDAPASPPTSSSMKSPYGVWSNGTRLYIVDSGNNRVLVWNTFPTSNGQAADFVLGQTSFDQGATNANSPEPNAVGVNRPRKAIEADGALFTSDGLNQRVVVHFPIPNSMGTPAVAVLGQSNLSSSTKADRPTADHFISPSGLAASHHKLYVSDYGFNRILRFHLGP